MTHLATVAKTFLVPLAASIALYAASAPLAPTAHAQAATTIKAPIYGVTLDDLSNLNAIITSLTKLPHKPMVRVVFDPGTSAAEYYPALVKLHAVAYVMGEIMDSYYFPTDINTYTARTKELVYALNGTVDVWEIANEINGEWLGSSAIEKMMTAIEVFRSDRATRTAARPLLMPRKPPSGKWSPPPTRS